MHLEDIMAGKSYSHHRCPFVCCVAAQWDVWRHRDNGDGEGVNGDTRLKDLAQ